MHEDGSVTVHYEVPAGNNECFELSKRLTPLVSPRCCLWSDMVLERMKEVSTTKTMTKATQQFVNNTDSV